MIKLGSYREYLIAFKHRIESERELFATTPRNKVLVLSKEDNRILAAQMDREEIRSIPCEEQIITSALQVFDMVTTLKPREGISHTVMIVFDHGEAFVADVAWDENPKVAMTVVGDEIVVLDEHL